MAQDDAAVARANFRAGLEVEARIPLHCCVELLHEAGYVVLGPENAEEAAALLGVLAFYETRPAHDELDLEDRARELLAAFPDSFVTANSHSGPTSDLPLNDAESGGTDAA